MGMDGGRGENVGTSLEFNGTGIFTGSLRIGRCFHFILSPYPKARVICVPNRDIPSARGRGTRYLLAAYITFAKVHWYLFS